MDQVEDVQTLSGLQALTGRLLEGLLTRPTRTPDATLRAVAALLRQQTALLTSDVVPRSELLKLQQEMGQVVDEVIRDDGLKRTIGERWLSIRTRHDLEARLAAPDDEEDDVGEDRASRQRRKTRARSERGKGGRVTRWKRRSQPR